MVGEEEFNPEPSLKKILLRVILFAMFVVIILIVLIGQKI